MRDSLDRLMMHADLANKEVKERRASEEGSESDRITGLMVEVKYLRKRVKELSEQCEGLMRDNEECDAELMKEEA
jgi:hypothetical protein